MNPNAGCLTPDRSPSWDLLHGSESLAECGVRTLGSARLRLPVGLQVLHEAAGVGASPLFRAK